MTASIPQPTASTVADTVRAAAAALGRDLTDPVDLGGSARSRVVRCRTADDTTVVVKQFFTADSAWARETVGLEVLGRTPHLLATDEAHRIVVMSDLGESPPTLADLLLGDDREAAWAGARSWARTLGRMIGASRSVAREASRRINAGTPPGAPSWDAGADLYHGIERLVGLAPGSADDDNTVAEAEAIRVELAAAADLLTPDDRGVVWPADTCPDNAVLRTSGDEPDRGWWFLDLEGTDVGHPALAAAYAVLPFATCWCAFDPPPGLTDDLFAEFSAGLAEHAADVVADPAWTDQVMLACAAYVVLATHWLLDGALAGVPSVGPAGRSPSFRQLVASRWRWGAVNLRDRFPALSAALARASGWAWDHWGADAETTGYPAFA